MLEEKQKSNGENERRANDEFDTKEGRDLEYVMKDSSLKH